MSVIGHIYFRKVCDYTLNSSTLSYFRLI